MDFLKSIQCMEQIETLNSSKFDKLKVYQIEDASKVYEGVATLSQINLSTGTHWDAVETTGTNFYNDGEVIGGLANPNGPIPDYVNTWLHQL